VALRSALYEGSVTHRRFGPGPAHEFTYRVAMPLLYLDEVEQVMALHPLWSDRWAAPVHFKRSDFLGDPGSRIETSARELVEERLGTCPSGPVAMLANLRTWGWLFNPISLYYLWREDGAVGAVVAEVENTPWHERHAYVLGAPGRHRFAKVMHVSPFLPMELTYELAYSEPGRSLAVRLDVQDGSERLLGVTMSLRRQTLDRDALSRLLWHHRAPTHRVSAGIYAQAARLWRMGAPFHAHPRAAAAGKRSR
jgi:hypothetical protein